MEPTDWIVAIAGAVTALATAGLAFVAVLAWRKASETLDAMRVANRSAEAASRAAEASSKAQEQANEQTRTDSIRQTRPYVFVELIPGLAAETSADLRVTNSGRSKASDLRVSLDGWPSDGDDIVASVRDMCEHAHTLPPGSSFRFIWRIWAEEGRQLEDPSTKELTKESGMPERAVVTLNYADDGGSTYVDVYPVSIKGAGLTPVPSTGRQSDKSEPTRGDLLSLGQTIARYLGELNR